MPMGAMAGTSQIYLRSYLLRLLVHSGPVWFPSHCVTLQLVCPSDVKYSDTGVMSVFLLFLTLDICSKVRFLIGLPVSSMYCLSHFAQCIK